MPEGSEGKTTNDRIREIVKSLKLSCAEAIALGVALYDVHLDVVDGIHKLHNALMLMEDL